MKTIMMGVAAIAAMAAVQARAMSLADASAKVEEVANDASAMVEVVKQLAPEDQTAFLAKVNAAIASFPGTEAEKGAKYLNTAKAALAGADAKNRAAVLAEIFATVPPEFLTVINERLAADTFSRDADPTNPVTDDEMRKIALDTMQVIKSRNAGNDNEGVRDAFAILMFIRASKGSPADLRDALVDTLPTQEARNLAKTEWFPAALGEGREQSYEPMLAVVNDVTFPPLKDDIFGFGGDSVATGALLASLSSTVGSEGAGSTLSDSITVASDSGAATGGSTGGTGGMSASPRTLDPNSPIYGGHRRGGGANGSETAKEEGQGQGESGGYPYQTTF